MSHIDDLITEKCPLGVSFVMVGDLVDRVTKVRWDEVSDDESFQYIDLGSVDRATHVIRGTETITRATAPSRAQQVVREGDVLFGTTRPMLKRYSVVSADYDQQVASTGFCVLRPKSKRVLANFLFHMLGTAEFYTYVEANERGASYPAIPDTVVKKFRIPVPPLEVQREIVRVLDQFTQLEAELEAELEARKRQYEHYRNELLIFDLETSELRPLGDLAHNLDNKRKPVTRNAREPGDIPYYGASGVVDRVSDYIFDGDYLLVSEDGANLLARTTPIAFSISGKTWVNNHAHVLQFETYSERRFVEMYLNAIDLTPYISGAAQPKLNKANLNRIPIPDPPLQEKVRIVGVLDKFDSLVNDLSVGLPAELAARRKQYEYYRDKFLTFEEAAA